MSGTSRSPLVVAGHSLGAAEASIYAYSRIKRGLPLDQIFVFGCPRPGNGVLQSVVPQVPVWLSVRNAKPSPANRIDHDLVTDVPFDVSWLGDTYLEPVPFHDGYSEPLANDPWGIFRYHHIQLYQALCVTLAGIDVGVRNLLVTTVNAVADLYYNPNADWSFEHFINGQYWGGRTLPDGTKLLIARGSTTELDWVHDFESVGQSEFYDAKVSSGFLAGVAPAMADLDAWLDGG